MAGMNVNESIKDPPSANNTVSAIGRNNLPSVPSSSKIGRKTTAMMSSPNMVGFRTSTAASRMILSCFASPFSCDSFRIQFSTMMTELSTINPKSIAPRLIRLAVTPVNSITLVANNMESGIAKATIIPALKLPSMNNRTMTTSIPPSVKFVSTVLRVRPINAARS